MQDDEKPTGEDTSINDTTRQREAMQCDVGVSKIGELIQYFPFEFRMKKSKNHNCENNVAKNIVVSTLYLGKSVWFLQPHNHIEK